MRSRYCAYVLGLDRYLTETWHPSTRPARCETDDSPPAKWLGLEIKAAGETWVEFVARYKVNGRAHRLHEVSDFVREDGRWYYLSGSFPEN
ncbi:MAG: zinc chelation protein SecC [Rhodocyclaceae bacterium]|nr:zinc chelation protein SecC [Rhodocyclaceae bacterium]